MAPSSANDHREDNSQRNPFRYLSSQVTDFADRQRLERLLQCRDLESILRRCQQAKGITTARTDIKQAVSPSLEERPYQDGEVEQTVPGMRMTRYFGWRESVILPEHIGDSFVTSAMSGDANSREDNQQEADNEKQRSVASSSPVSCARETHCLWACRSVSLGCAPHMAKLKECFQQYNQSDLLSVNATAYEKTSSDIKGVVCRQLQEELGACVAQSAADLQQRRRKVATSKSS